jgi:hypothetical protein
LRSGGDNVRVGSLIASIAVKLEHIEMVLSVVSRSVYACAGVHKMVVRTTVMDGSLPTLVT